MKIKIAEYIKSAVYEKDFPDESKEVEFAFVGRSNVGKSSLINSLTQRKKLAKTSKTPGRTQLINYFNINNQFYFVDLPGYGFAKVSKKMKGEWGKVIGNYLLSSREKIIFVLLDIRRIPNEDDLEMLNWLQHYNINFKIIFTKIDKLSNNEKFKQIKSIRTRIDFDNKDVFFHSSLKNKGNNELLEFIDSNLIDILEEIDVK